VYTPDDSVCEEGQLCGKDGCLSYIYVSSMDALYEVQIPSGKSRIIGVPGLVLADIALAPSGILYGTDGLQLFPIDRATGTTTGVVGLTTASFNALAVSATGALFAAAHGKVYSIDATSFKASEVATLPSSFASSGDLAFFHGALYLTARCTYCDSDVLLEVDLAGGSATRIGSIGYRYVYGLAPLEGVLYAFTEDGVILQIDPLTGAGTYVAATGLRVWGATSGDR
jgi:outer membrane protein assembly factor BamB